MNIIFIFPIYVLILFIIISIVFSKTNFYKEITVLKRNIILLFISIVSFYIIKNLFTYISIYNRYNTILKTTLDTILFFSLCILCIYIGFKFVSNIDTINKNEDCINKLNKKIEHKDSIIAKLRSQKHDYLKHLQVVSSLLNTGLSEDAKNYITTISNSFRSKTSRYGKVSYLDAIAALKYEECLVKGIAFDVYIQDFIDNLVIEPDKMSSVLLNIIDNGIESLSSISKDNKYIKMFIYEDEFQYVISIKNNGPKIYDTDMIFLEGYSTKDGENRGYGLYSIKNILDKYGYHIFASSDDFVTEFAILIPKYC